MKRVEYKKVRKLYKLRMYQAAWRWKIVWKEISSSNLIENLVEFQLLFCEQKIAHGMESSFCMNCCIKHNIMGCYDVMFMMKLFR